MNIDEQIKKWEEKHFSLLNEYSKGNANNEVMQMYRSQMKNVLDFINELKQVKNNIVLADVSGQSELLFAFAKYVMPDNYTQIALNNIVKTFIEERK